MVRRVKYDNNQFQVESADGNGQYESKTPNTEDNKQLIAKGYVNVKGKIYHRGTKGGSANQEIIGEELGALIKNGIKDKIKPLEGGDQKKHEEQKDLGAPNQIEFNNNGKIKGTWQRGNEQPKEHLLYGKELENFFDKYVAKEQKVLGSKQYQYSYLNNLLVWVPIQDKDKPALLKEAALVNKKIPILYKTYLINDEDTVELTPYHKLNDVQYYKSKNNDLIYIVDYNTEYPIRVFDPIILSNLRNETNRIEAELARQEIAQKRIEALQKNILTAEDIFNEPINQSKSIENGRFTDLKGNILNDNQSIQVLLKQFVKERNSYTDFFKYYKVFPYFPNQAKDSPIDSYSKPKPPSGDITSSLTSLIIKEENRLNTQVPLKYTAYNSIRLTPYHIYEGTQYYKEETRGDIYTLDNNIPDRVSAQEVGQIMADIYKIQRREEEEKRQLQLTPYNTMQLGNYDIQQVQRYFKEISDVESIKENELVDYLGIPFTDQELREILSKDYVKEQPIYKEFFIYYKRKESKVLNAQFASLIALKERELNIQIPIKFTSYKVKDRDEYIDLTPFHQIDNIQYYKDRYNNNFYYTLNNNDAVRITNNQTIVKILSDITKIDAERRLDRYVQKDYSDYIEPVGITQTIINNRLSNVYGYEFNDNESRKILLNLYRKDRPIYGKPFIYYNYDNQTKIGTTVEESATFVPILMQEEIRLNTQIPLLYKPYKDINGFTIYLTPYHKIITSSYFGGKTEKEYWIDNNQEIYINDTNKKAYKKLLPGKERTELEKEIENIDRTVYGKVKINKNLQQDTPYGGLIDGIQHYRDVNGNIYFLDTLGIEKIYLNPLEVTRLKQKMELSDSINQYDIISKREQLKRDYEREADKTKQDINKALLKLKYGSDENIKESRTPETRYEEILYSNKCPREGTQGFIAYVNNEYVFSYKERDITKSLYIRSTFDNKLEVKSYTPAWIKTKQSCEPKLFINFVDNERIFGVLVSESNADTYPSNIIKKYNKWYNVLY